MSSVVADGECLVRVLFPKINNGLWGQISKATYIGCILPGLVLLLQALHLILNSTLNRSASFLRTDNWCWLNNRGTNIAVIARGMTKFQ